MREEPANNSDKNTEVQAGTKVTPERQEEALDKEDKKDREEELECLLEIKEKEATENYDRLLRTQAEFENYKKRIKREKEDTIKFCNENLLRELLPVLDNLEAALKHGKDPKSSQSLMEGVVMVLDQFLKSLEKFGVTGFSSIGEKFDPNRHEAMMKVEGDESEVNSVVSEFQKGYFLNDRLLRPAKVTVATLRSKPDTGDGSVERKIEIKTAEE